MDRTSIIVIVVCFVLLGLWSFVLMPKLYPPKPLPPGLTNTPVVTVTSTNVGVRSAVAPPELEAAPVAPRTPANTNVAEELVPVKGDKAEYIFSSHGGGLKLVELLDYPETVAGRRQKQPQTNQVATLNRFAPAPSLAVLDGDAMQGDGIFRVTKTEKGVRAEKTLTNGLSIVKDFEISSNYVLAATVRLENHAAQPLALPSQEWVVGTATPMGPRDNGQAVGVLWYNGSKTEEVGGSYFSSRGFACIPRVPPSEYRAGASNVVWVAAHNQFFALAAMPQQPAVSVIARKIDLPRPTGAEAELVATNAPPPQGYETMVVYPGLTLAPDQTVTNRFYIYAGPKEYQTLARLGDRLGNNVDLIMGYSGFFGFFSKALLLGMNWLHSALRLSYGWAVIAITVIIKLVYWPLTQASTRSLKRMQALQPQMNAIREKYKDDPVKMNRKVMEFMKEHKVSPLGGCLPSILQIPVFFGFYRMIQSAIELRGARFLWVNDLSQPDTLTVIPGLGFVPFIGIPGVGLPVNLLPLIMGATMLWQARLTPPSPGMDPMQQKLMRYMPLMFMVFLYNFSAGLTLYWTVQNLLTIAQTKLTKNIQVTPAAPTPPKGPSAKGPVLTPAQKKRK
jgi:YidC/Oxa1 family membrane protein insertase